MSSSRSSEKEPITRRRFLTATALGAAGLGLYSGEFERHHLEITYPEVRLPNLPPVFDGFRMAQLSDIHLDMFTEPYFLRDIVARINRLRPDAVFLTGDFVTHQWLPHKYPIHAAWACARILDGIECTRRYAILGNHDVVVSAQAVTAALTASRIPVLRNSFAPLELGASRLWLAGLDDPVEGHPDLDQAIPEFLRDRADQPVLLMCHAPDYADTVLAHPAGKSVAFMLSGHTHGGQIRAPFLGPMVLPDLGKKYVEGLFQLQGMQLYVNRGLGTVGVPVRFNCPPELTCITLRRA
ncbi:MAG TPA: metallophosphoesterase [Terracidiphilus sp.]